LLATSAADDARLEELETMIDEGWWRDAEEELKEIIGRDGNSARAHYLLALIYLRELDMGRRLHWDEAEDHVRKAVDLDGDDPENLMLLGHITGIKARDGSKLSAFGRAKTSKGSYEKAVEIDPDNIEARKWLINFHLNAPGFAGGDKDEARTQAEELVKIDPAEGRYAMADIYEFLEKDIQKAEREYAKAIRENPGESRPYYEYADHLARRGRYDRAESLMTVLSGLEPSSSSPLFRIARYRESAGRWDEAVSSLEKLSETDSTRSRALMSLGFIYQRREMWEEALPYFELAFGEYPDNYHALYQAGMTRLMGRLDLEPAAAAFREYIDARTREYWPSEADAWWRLAMVYEEQGDRNMALKACREARKADPKHEQAGELLKKLKRR
jgi:tetratricopeptide (TPR) repeat protein